MNRSVRLRRVRRNPAYVAGRGVFVLLLCGTGAYIALRAYDGVPLKDYRTLVAEVPDAGNLRSHDQVRLAGVRIGQVKALDITPRGTARMTLQIEPSAPRIPVDSGVKVRSAGLLGARSVEVLPGRSAQMAGAGTVLKGGRFAKTYGVSEALEVFDAETRGGSVKTIDGFSEGLAGNARRINQLLDVNSRAQLPFQRLATGMLGQNDALDRFVPSAQRMMGVLDASRDDIADLLAPTAEGLRPFAEERAALQRTLQLAPGALDTTGRGLTRGRALLAATRRLSFATTAALEPAPKGLRAAATLLRTSKKPLDRGAALLQDLKPAVPDTLQTLTAVRPILKPLSEAVGDLVPLADQVAAHGCDIENFGAVFRSMTGLAVPGPNGPLGKFRLHLMPSPLESVGLNAAGSGTTNVDPYSAPCKYTGPRSTEAYIEPVRPNGAGG